MDTQSKLVAGYLKDLERAATVLPAGRRKELVAQIRDHLEGAMDELRQDPAGQGEAGVRALLDRLGPPEEIVRAAVGELPPGPVNVSTVRELLGALFMTAGSVLLPVVGWLIGIAIMWTSVRLRTRDKVLGTLVVPGGVGGLLYLGLITTRSCLTSSTTNAAGQTVTTEDTCHDLSVWLQRFESGAAIVALIAALLVPFYLLNLARQHANAEERLRADLR